jgi:serine/threonine protein kinase
VPGVARLEAGGSAPDELLRSWIGGHPLHETPTLPRDFFDRLRELVEAIHGRGVCHNDLHKEQNVLVDERGFPALVDFQLASVHERRNRRYRVRCAEDLRHVEKTRRRYARRGAKSPPAGPRPRRSALAWTWRRIGKPIYNVAVGALGGRDREPRRPSSGPWPEWTEPVGRRMS